MDELCLLNGDCTKCVKWPIICPLVSAASFAHFESFEVTARPEQRANLR